MKKNGKHYILAIAAFVSLLVALAFTILERFRPEYLQYFRFASYLLSVATALYLAKYFSLDSEALNYTDFIKQSKWNYKGVILFGLICLFFLPLLLTLIASFFPDHLSAFKHGIFTFGIIVCISCFRRS